MNKFQVILAFASFIVAIAEPPVLSGGYGYGRSLHGVGAAGSIIIGGGGGSFQTHEGQHVDPQLLHKVKEILLEHEQLEHAHRGHHSASYITAPSDSYGPSSQHYGPPVYHHNDHVVGIELGHIQPSIQVAHYHQAEHEHYTSPGLSYGLPAISVPSGSYGPPPVVHIPSGSYGLPSDSYGAPHH